MKKHLLAQLLGSYPGSCLQVKVVGFALRWNLAALENLEQVNLLDAQVEPWRWSPLALMLVLAAHVERLVLLMLAAHVESSALLKAPLQMEGNSLEAIADL